MQKILYKTSDENLITYFFQKSDVIVGNLLANSRLSPYFLHKGSSLKIIKTADD